MKDQVSIRRRDTRVSDEELEQFLRSELAKKMLMIDEGEFVEDLRKLRESFTSDKSRTKIYLDFFESEKDLLERLESVLEDDLDVIDYLQIVSVDGVLYRFDFDTESMLPLERSDLRRICSFMNKTRFDKLMRDIEKSGNVSRFSADSIETYSEKSTLSKLDIVTPTLQEVLDLLSEDESTKMLILQILLQVVYDYRFEDKLIVVSGAKSRKELFASLLRVVSDDRVASSTVKMYEKKRLTSDLISSRVLFIDSDISRQNQIGKIVESSNFVSFTDEFNAKTFLSNSILLPLDRSDIDDVDSKIKLLETLSSRDAILTDLESRKDEVRFNRFVRSENRLNKRLIEFIEYLRETSVLGREEIPSSFIYALYLDYCSFRRLKSDYTSQSAFTKEISLMLSEHKYYVAEKSERIKTVLKRSDFSDEYLEEMKSSNLRVKELLDNNKISKVFKLNLDVKDLNERLIEKRMYHVSDLRLYSLHEELIDKCMEENCELVDNLARRLKQLISDNVRDSAFETYELIRFLTRNLFLDCERFDLKNSESSEDLSKIYSQVTDITEILQTDVSSSLKTRLILDQFEELSKIEDRFNRSIEIDKLDTELMSLLEEHSDFRSIRIKNDFAKTVDPKRKLKLRVQMIEILCKDVKVV